MSRGGFVKLQRSAVAEDLMRDPMAMHLLTVIAVRARFTDEPNLHGLTFGQALLGDYKAIGMTEKEYRCAKSRLAKYGLASFATSNKGTIATLLDSRVFSLRDERNLPDRGDLKGGQFSEEKPANGADGRAGQGRTEGGPGATNQNGKHGEHGEHDSQNEEGMTGMTLAGASARVLPTTADEVRRFGAVHGIPDERANAWWHMNSQTAFRVSGAPMFDWHKAFLSWAESDAERSAAGRDQLSNTDFWKWIREEGYPIEAANRFIAYNNKHGWRQENPLTHRMEPIRDVKKAFVAFFESLSDCERDCME